MQKLRLFPFLFFIFLFSAFYNPTHPVLKLKIYNISPSQGNLIIYIYNKEGSIPDKNFSRYYKKKSIPVTDNQAEISFTNLPQGRYAVMVLHDENKNGKLDKTFMKPKEGFGLSNFKKISLFNKPSFKKASFKLQKDTLITIKTIYL